MLANTKNQSLDMHSFAVGELSVVIFENLLSESNIDKIIENEIVFKNVLRFSGYLHDVGKIDNFFQNLLINGKKNDKLKFETNDGTHVQTNKITLDSYFRHNELSFILINQLINKKEISPFLGNNYSLKDIEYIAYWHHAKIIRKNKENYQNFWNELLKQNKKDELENNFIYLIDKINKIHNTYHNKNDNFLNFVEKNNIDSIFNLLKFPGFKENYSTLSFKNDEDESNTNISISKEARKSLLRAIVVSADRIISKLEKEDLEKYIYKSDGYNFSDLLIKEIKFKNGNENLISSIEIMLAKFETEARLNNDIKNLKRNKKQSEVVKKLLKHKSPVILSGPAGCGKTKIFLEWIKDKELELNTNQKVFIIAPRNMICKGLYDELISKYLPNEEIEIYTGDYQLKYKNNIESEILENEQFHSKIIITTIDQILNIILSHRKIDIVLDLLNSYLIFDEFHEFFNIPGIVVLFKELLLLKQITTDSKTLLVSATPNYFFADFINCKVEKIETFNDIDYEISFEETEDINSMSNCGINNFELNQEINNKKNGSIVIYNTATNSQLSTLYNYKKYNEKSINYHSKFNDNDKNKLSKEIMKNWGKEFNTEKILRAGPIIQASLNITTHLMLTEMTCSENWCQRLGRLNRFANPNITAKFITYFEKELLNDEIKIIGSAKTLKYLNELYQTVTWCNFIKDKKINKISQIYDLYEEYHGMADTKKSYKKDFSFIIEDSQKLFSQNNQFEPYQTNTKEKTSNKLSRRSLRGRSLYVLPVKFDLSNNKKEWLYIPDDESLENINNSLTLNISDIDPDFQKVLSKATLQATYFSKKSTGNKNAIITYEDKLLKYLNQDIVLRKAREINYPFIISDINNDNEGKFYITNGNLLIGLIDIRKVQVIDEEIFISNLINRDGVKI